MSLEESVKKVQRESVWYINLETSEIRIGHLNWIQLKLVGIHRTTRFQKKMLLLHN